MEEECAPVRPELASTDRTPSLTGGATSFDEKLASPPWEDEVDEWEKETKPRFPSTTVDAYSIGNVMATRLAICLLGFVLFLKSQVPVPISQLVKLRSSNSSNNKKLDKLLTTFDVLSEHLGSTFTALAVAFARATDASRASHNPDLAKAHLAIVLGPSPTSLNAARARVILELDGVRVDPHGPVSEAAEDAMDIAATTDEDGIPSPLIRAEDDTSYVDAESDLEISDTDSEEGEITDDDESSFFEETEADLSAAERNLSRTLANANSDSEMGLASDIRPTYSHILLRAPRSFSHPSWTPRQSLARDMDPLLRGFSESIEVDNPCNETSLKTQNNTTSSGGTATITKGKALGGTVKTDYVRVQSQGAAAGDPFDVSIALGGNDEEDGSEMIWWSWDGKFEGFTEI